MSVKSPNRKPNFAGAGSSTSLNRKHPAVDLDGLAVDVASGR